MEWPGRTIIFVEVGGRGDGNSQKKSLQKQKSPNKLFADMKKKEMQEDATGKNCLHRQ